MRKRHTADIAIQIIFEKKRLIKYSDITSKHLDICTYILIHILLKDE